MPGKPARVQSSRNTQALWFLTSMITAWTVGVLWIALIPGQDKAIHAEQRTRETIYHTQQIIRSFISQWKEVPRNLNEIRAFSFQKPPYLGIYDGFGERIEYVRLNRDEFFLRSFGSDLRADTIVSDGDLAVGRWASGYQMGIHLQQPYTWRTYPPIALEGAFSLNKKFVARLYFDRASGLKRLVVRGLTSKLVMIAPHDGIDEFLWHDSSQSLIFSASTTENYQGSVFHWDLATGRVKDLLDNPSPKAALTGRESAHQERWLTLVGWDTKDAVALQLMPKRSDVLDPLEFYSPQHAYVLGMDGTLEPRDVIDSDLDMVAFTHNDAIDVGKLARKVQRVWSMLPIDGSFEENLAAWQDFCEKYTYSPIFPYGLWYLAIFYSEAASSRERSVDEANVLSAYSIEVAKALTELQPAPAHLRAFAVFHLAAIARSEEIRYTVSRGPSYDPATKEFDPYERQHYDLENMK